MLQLNSSLIVSQILCWLLLVACAGQDPVAERTRQDVVQAVRYLTEARFVTGHVLPVDGGRLLGPAGPPEVGERDEG